MKRPTPPEFEARTDNALGCPLGIGLGIVLGKICAKSASQSFTPTAALAIGFVVFFFAAALLGVGLSLLVECIVNLTKLLFYFARLVAYFNSTR